MPDHKPVMRHKYRKIRINNGKLGVCPVDSWRCLSRRAMGCTICRLQKSDRIEQVRRARSGARIRAAREAAQAPITVRISDA